MLYRTELSNALTVLCTTTHQQVNGIVTNKSDAYELARLLARQGIISNNDIGLVTAIIELQQHNIINYREQRMDKIKKILLIALIAIIVLTWVSSVIGAIAQKSHTPDNSVAVTNPRGLAITRDTYIASCKRGYNNTGASTIGDDRLGSYCACTWDTGLHQFGEEAFLVKLNQTPLPSDINNIVNNCLQKALK